MLDLSVRLRLIDKQFRASVDKLNNSLQGVKSRIKTSDAAFPKANASMKTLNSEIGRTPSLLRRAFNVAAIGVFVKQAVNLAESYKSINARLNLAANSQADFNNSQEETLRISKKTGTSLDGNVGLYQKLRINVGLSADEAVRLTETLAKASQLDGGGAAAEAALRQFQQAATSGVLGGEELRSVREQLPTLADAIRKGLGLTREAFSELRKTGGIEFSKVVEGINKQTDNLDARFALLPKTTKGSFENLVSVATVEIGKLDGVLNISGTFASAIDFITKNIKTLIGATAAVLTVITGNWLRSIFIRRAAEKAAHVAHLREIAIEQAAQLASAKTAALNRLPVNISAVKSAQSALDDTRKSIVGAGKSALSFTNIMGRLGGVLKLALSPLTLIVVAFTAFLAIIRNLVQAQGIFSASLQKPITLLEVLSATVGIAIDALSALLRNFVGFVGYLSGTAFDAIANIAKEFGISFGTALEFGKNFFNGIINFLPSLGLAFGTVAGFIVQTWKNAFSDISNIIIAFGKDAQAALTGDFSGSNTKAALGQAVNNIQTQVGLLKDGLTGALDRFSEDTFKGISESVGKRILAQRVSAEFKSIEEGDGTGNGVTTGNGADTKAGKARLASAQKLSKAETTLLNEELASRLADLERAYAEEVLLAGDNVTEKTKLAIEYYNALNQLAIQQTAIDKKQLDDQLANKLSQQEAIASFVPTSASETASQQAALQKLAVEMDEINANIEAQNIKLETTLKDNNAKAREVSIQLIQAQQEAVADLENQVDALNEEAQALSLSEDAYKEYLLQKRISSELNKLEVAGIEKTSAAYREQAEALEGALRAQEEANAVKAQRDERNRQRDDIFRNVQEGVQNAFSSAFNAIGSDTTFKELGFKAATAIREALTEAVSGRLTDLLLNSIGGKDAVVGAAGLFGFGGGAEPGTNIASPLFTKDVDSVVGGLTPDAIFTEKADGLFAKVSDIFTSFKSGFSNILSGLSNSLGGLFGSIGSGGGLGSLFSAGLGLFGFASGGYTGNGGKYEPKGVVHGGEYVFTKKSVGNLGLGFLEGLHAMANGGMAPTMPRFGYAEGGVVDIPVQQGASSQSVKIINSIDPEMAGEYLQSKAGEKVLHNYITRNAKRLSSVLANG